MKLPDPKKLFDTKTKRTAAFSAAAAVLLLIVILLLFPIRSGKRVSYPEFSAALEAGQVESLTFRGEDITYRLTDENRLYRTDNPDYDSFRAELLEAGVSVSGGTEDNSANVLDILFDIVFFAAVAFALWKVLSSQRNTFKLIRHTGVHFSDIAGLDNVKCDMASVLNGLKAPSSSVRPVHGIILEGPPGNGKTLFARALAEECGVNFIATRGADFQSAVMSIGPAKIKSLFRKARRHSPCIIFIDEFDGIGEKRSYAGAGIDKENNRLIITLLNEMDGFTVSDGVLVVAATNSYASLDAALIRPGRFDLKYTIPNPDAAARRQLIRKYSRGLSLAADCPLDMLTAVFDGMSCAAIETLLNEAVATASQAGKTQIDSVCIAEARRKTRL